MGFIARKTICVQKPQIPPIIGCFTINRILSLSFFVVVLKLVRYSVVKAN